MAQKGEYPLKLSLGDKFTGIVSSRDRIYTFGDHEEDNDGPVSKI